MRIKTFRASTAGEALALIRKEFGPDAVILHTRTAKLRSVLGLVGRTYTEITASSEPERKPAARATRPMPVAAAAQPRRAEAPAPASGERAQTYGNTAVRALARELLEKHERAAAAAPVAVVARAEAATSIAVTAAEARSLAAGDAWVRELSSLKQMVGQVLRSSRSASQPNMPAPLFECYRKLIESEVSDELADRIAGDVRDELSRHELEDPTRVRRAVLRRLAKHIPVAPALPDPRRAADGRPLTIALVGPTGVGKTTTLAKLAATYRLRHGKKVGMITTDTYRIAAVDQLRTYANIIGVPLRVAMTPAEISQACEALESCDVILIDTAGRSPRDADRIDELGRFLAVAKPHQVHLVLASTASGSAMHAAAERFSVLRPAHVIFTKLDEAVGLGVVLSVMEKLSATLSFITTGQEVPDDLECGNADRLASMVLAGTGVGVGAGGGVYEAAA